jgi:hypothetical protein
MVATGRRCAVLMCVVLVVATLVACTGDDDTDASSALSAPATEQAPPATSSSPGATAPLGAPCLRSGAAQGRVTACPFEPSFEVVVDRAGLRVSTDGDGYWGLVDTAPGPHREIAFMSPGVGFSPDPPAEGGGAPVVETSADVVVWLRSQPFLAAGPLADGAVGNRPAVWFDVSSTAPVEVPIRLVPPSYFLEPGNVARLYVVDTEGGPVVVVVEAPEACDGCEAYDAFLAGAEAILSTVEFLEPGAQGQSPV